VVALLEGDLPEVVADLAAAARHEVARHGPAAIFAALYFEESGIPSPVPGDVFVLYLGTSGSGHPLTLFLLWLGVILAVSLGSTNLYLISRHLGHRLLVGRLGRILHVTPQSLARAEDWFGRYGALAIIFGRHVPGLRIPLTVAAGLLEVRYLVFLPSVAVSSGIWAGVWIVVGATYGRRVERYLELHRHTYLLVPAALLLLGAILLVRHLRARRQAAEAETPGPTSDHATDVTSLSAERSRQGPP
jgi:membrane protein DedA with SNARE-associated domain